MSSSSDTSAIYELAPLGGGPHCTLELSAEMLTLNASDGHTVLMLPREEAARYMNFDWDLRRGRVIAFRLLGGLRSMRFLCGDSLVAAITHWLPAAAPSRFPRHLIFTLCTVPIGLLYPPTRPVAFAVLLAAILAAAPPRARLAPYAVSILAASAATALFGPVAGLFSAAPAVVCLYGALLVLATLETAAGTSANRAILAARAAATARPGRHHSRLVRGVASGALAAAVSFAGLALFLYLQPLANIANSTDPLVMGLAALALAAPVPLLLLRRRPPYAEALLVAQLLIAFLVIYAWGLASAGLADTGEQFQRGVFVGVVRAGGTPYFALPLLVLELAFRYWFVRAAMREEAEED